jgi:hypothetical protein
LRKPCLNLADLGLRIVQLRHDQAQDRPRQFRQAGFVFFDRCLTIMTADERAGCALGASSAPLADRRP